MWSYNKPAWANTALSPNVVNAKEPATLLDGGANAKFLYSLIYTNFKTCFYYAEHRLARLNLELFNFNTEQHRYF